MSTDSDRLLIAIMMIFMTSLVSASTGFSNSAIFPMVLKVSARVYDDELSFQVILDSDKNKISCKPFVQFTTSDNFLDEQAEKPSLEDEIGKFQSDLFCKCVESVQYHTHHQSSTTSTLVVLLSPDLYPILNYLSIVCIAAKKSGSWYSYENKVDLAVKMFEEEEFLERENLFDECSTTFECTEQSSTKIIFAVKISDFPGKENFLTEQRSAKEKSVISLENRENCAKLRRLLKGSIPSYVVG